MSHILIRKGTESDQNLIYNSWLRSAQEDSDMAKHEFFQVYRDHIQGLLERAEVTVACDPTHPDHIMGYIVHQKVDGVFLLHWAYTKAPFRKLGVMKDLIKSEFPELKSEPLIITYKNDKRPKMFLSLKTLFRPDFRSIN